MSQKQWGHGYHVGKKEGFEDGFETGDERWQDLGAFGATLPLVDKCRALLKVIAKKDDDFHPAVHALRDVLDLAWFKATGVLPDHYWGSSNYQNAADPPVSGAAKIGDDSGESVPLRAGR